MSDESKVVPIGRKRQALSFESVANYDILCRNHFYVALNTHAHSLQLVLSLPRKYHSLGMEIDGRRIYCFEKNTDRWPDGRYYMLNRDYEYWCGFKTSFTLEELAEIGVLAWARSRAIRYVYGDTIIPMAPDEFMYRPKTWTAVYVQTVFDLLRYVRKQLIEEHCGGEPRR